LTPFPDFEQIYIDHQTKAVTPVEVVTEATEVVTTSKEVSVYGAISPHEQLLIILLSCRWWWWSMAINDCGMISPTRPRSYSFRGQEKLAWFWQRELIVWKASVIIFWMVSMGQPRGLFDAV